MARPRKVAVKTEDGKPVDTWDVVTHASKDIKFDEGDYNPPKWRNFVGKNFSEQEMEEMFEHKTLKNTDFTGADLTGADFTGFNLQGSKFKNAILTGTIFIGADVRWSDFQGSNYREAIWAEFDDNGFPINRADTRETLVQ